MLMTTYRSKWKPEVEFQYGTCKCQFVHMCDAGYFIRINQPSFLTWVMNNHFLRLCIV